MSSSYALDFCHNRLVFDRSILVGTSILRMPLFSVLMTVELQRRETELEVAKDEAEKDYEQWNPRFVKAEKGFYK